MQSWIRNLIKKVRDFQIYVSECSEIEKEIILLDRSSDDNVDS
jgi:hypothetical protein